MIWRPFGYLYQGAVSFRNWCYDSGVCKARELSVPVVSVGNLTVGGTGKTPVVAELVEWSRAQGLSVGVISRGYKGKYKGVQRVSSHVEDQPIWGDEPTMLARRFPDVPVFVHPDRYLAGKTLLERFPVDWIIADDAFQHRQLQRRMDVVVFDASAPLWQAQILPVGRARETMNSLSRADFVILSKVNLASEEGHQNWRRILMDWVGSEQLLEVSYRLMEIRSLGGQPENVKSENLWLISGIGNPYSFERMMVQAGYQVGGHSAFPDHHNYTTEDIRTLREQVKNMGVRRVVTTSKDLTKLVKFDELKEILCEAVLGLEWGPQREKMDSDLLRLVR